ncbi:hypothetical protein SUDANB54_06996 (plasmid) [Streptomyces sp. enrichment culture]
MRLGWVDSARWASRELIETTTPHCTDEMLDRLTAVLLGYYPAGERRRQKGQPSAWGRSQYELLSAICPSRRSEAVRRRLAEWDRKFPGNVPSPPTPIQTGVVGSPISDHAARHMTDDQWHRALDKYAHPQPERFWPLRGGVHELARTLGSRAQQQPDRFTDFAFTLGPGSPAAYLCAIVEAVTPHLDADHWERLALHTHQTLGSEAAPTICRALQATPQNFTSALLPALDGYTTDPHPEQDVRHADTHGTRTDLLTAGMNATRGQAALTVAALLFHGSEHLHALTPLVTRLANDPVLAVRVCAAQAVLALMRHDPQIALDTAEQLLNHQDANVYNASTTQRLLINTLVREPSRFAAHLARALQGTGDTAELAGQSWAVATIQGCLTPDLPNSTDELNALARRGAAAVSPTTSTTTRTFSRCSTTMTPTCERTHPWPCGRYSTYFLNKPTTSSVLSSTATRSLTTSNIWPSLSTTTLAPFPLSLLMPASASFSTRAGSSATSEPIVRRTATTWSRQSSAFIGKAGRPNGSVAWTSSTGSRRQVPTG